MEYGHRKSDAELKQKFNELCSEAAKGEEYLWDIFAAIQVVTARIFHRDLTLQGDVKPQGDAKPQEDVKSQEDAKLQKDAQPQEDVKLRGDAKPQEESKSQEDVTYVLPEAEIQMFQSRMRELKKVYALTDKEIADKLGVSRTTVQGILGLNESTARDSFPLREEYVIKICYNFSISPNYLFGETDDMFEIQIKYAEERQQYAKMVITTYKKLYLQGIPIESRDEAERNTMSESAFAEFCKDKDLMFPIILDGTKDERIKAESAISNIILTGRNVCGYSVETIHNYIEIFARLSSLGESAARKIFSASGGLVKSLAKKVDFQKAYSKRRIEYMRFVKAEYETDKTFSALEERIINNLQHQTNEYCDFVCAVASLDQPIVFELLDTLKEEYLPREYIKSESERRNQDRNKNEQIESLHINFLL